MQDKPRPPSTLDLISTTPMRDLLRGRLTGRLDVPSALEDLGLPPEVEQRIVRDVSKSGVPPLHRPVTARHYAARSKALLERGFSVEMALDHLGTPRKLRRSMRAWHSITFGAPVGRRIRRFVWNKSKWAVLSMLLMFAVASWRYWTGRPTIARNFVEEWNVAIDAIPPDERAWPLYLRVIELRRDPSYFEPGWGQRDEPNWHAARPGDRVWPEVLRFLDTQRNSLALIRDAAAKPSVGVRLSNGMDPGLQAIYPDSTGYPTAEPNPPVIQITLPALGYQRSFARLMRADLRAAGVEGDGERALTASIAMLDLARQAREPGLLIADLTSHAILSMAGQAVAETLLDHPDLWDAAQLDRLSHALAMHDSPEGRFQVSTRFERALLLDFLQRAYTDDGAGSGRLTDAGVNEVARMSSNARPGLLHRVFVGPINSLAAPSRRKVWEEWDRRLTLVEGQLQAPIWECPPVARLEFPPPATPRRMFYSMLDTLLPALGKCYRAAAVTTQDLHAARTIVALHRYRLDHDRYPHSLEALVPSYVSSLPIDCVDGSPMRYRAGDTGPILYSVGRDGDDDDGRRALLPSGEAVKGWLPPEMRGTAPDGDFVYWPPHRMVSSEGQTDPT